MTQVDYTWKTQLRKFTPSFFLSQQNEFLQDQLSIQKLFLLRNNQKWLEWEQGHLMHLLENLLIRGELKDDVRKEVLLSPEMKTYFITSFTHNSVDESNNYEAFEFLGDLTYNKCVGYYIVRRYPQLLSCEAADILTRLKIKIVKSKTMGTLARKQGLIKFIRYNPYNFNFQKTSIHKIGEDVLESLLGSIEFFMDNKFGLGAGYALCYRIIKNWLDEIHFDLSFDQLVDPYTILKEIHDKYKDLGTLNKYNVHRMDANTVEVTLSSYNNSKVIILGKLCGNILLGSEDETEQIEELKQKVAHLAIEQLSQTNHIHPDRNKYQRYKL